MFCTNEILIVHFLYYIFKIENRKIKMKNERKNERKKEYINEFTLI